MERPRRPLGRWLERVLAPGGSPPEGQAVLLLTLCDEQGQVAAAVPLVAGPAAEGEELAVKARMPGAIAVQVPQAVLAGQRCGQGWGAQWPPGQLPGRAWPRSPGGPQPAGSRHLGGTPRPTRRGSPEPRGLSVQPARAPGPLSWPGLPTFLPGAWRHPRGLRGGPRRGPCHPSSAPRLPPPRSPSLTQGGPQHQEGDRSERRGPAEPRGRHGGSGAAEPAAAGTDRRSRRTGGRSAGSSPPPGSGASPASFGGGPNGGLAVTLPPMPRPAQGSSPRRRPPAGLRG